MNRERYPEERQEALKLLLQAEREGRERVERAGEEARRVIDEARRRADAQVEEVRRKAEDEAEKLIREARHAAHERRERASPARSEAIAPDVDSLHRGAGRNLEQAVDYLVSWVTDEKGEEPREGM